MSREPYIASVQAGDNHDPNHPDHGGMIAIRFAYAGLKGDQYDVDHITEAGAVELIVQLSKAIDTLHKRQKR